MSHFQTNSLLILMKLSEIFLLSVLKQTFTLEFQLFCEQMEKNAVLSKEKRSWFTCHHSLWHSLRFAVGSGSALATVTTALVPLLPLSENSNFQRRPRETAGIKEIFSYLANKATSFVHQKPQPETVTHTATSAAVFISHPHHCSRPVDQSKDKARRCAPRSTLKHGSNMQLFFYWKEKKWGKEKAQGRQRVLLTSVVVFRDRHIRDPCQEEMRNPTATYSCSVLAEDKLYAQTASPPLCFPSPTKPPLKFSFPQRAMKCRTEVLTGEFPHCPVGFSLFCTEGTALSIRLFSPT